MISTSIVIITGSFYWLVPITELQHHWMEPTFRLSLIQVGNVSPVLLNKCMTCYSFPILQSFSPIVVFGPILSREQENHTPRQSQWAYGVISTVINGPNQWWIEQRSTNGVLFLRVRRDVKKPGEPVAGQSFDDLDQRAASTLTSRLAVYTVLRSI